LDRRIVSFDAAGTLLALREAVGRTYSRLAARHGYDAAPEVVEAAFRRTFPMREPLVCPPGSNEAELLSGERAWWKAVVKDAFNGDSSFDGFNEFFDETYEFFSHATAWQLFDDVRPVLKSIKEKGCRMAVISNFDSRLAGLLVELGVNDLFDGVFVSSRMGAAKPDPAIFERAILALSPTLNHALHIGDSWSDDVEGALAAGIQAVWLDRRGDKADPVDTRVTRIPTLFDLPDLL
jgi:putative hydrolase of the HAD superfamily